MTEIFISHSSKDKKLVDIFIDKLLICGMNFSGNDIFCTSTEGMGIKSGEDWRKVIRKNLIGSKAVILFLTPNYKESEICLNEMGAAWTIDAEVIPVTIEPVNYENIGVIFDVKQAVSITDESKLDDLRDSLLKIFKKDANATSRWNTKKTEMMVLVKEELKNNKFPLPLSRDIFLKLEKNLKNTENTIKELILEKQKLEEYCERLEKTKNKEDIIKAKEDSGLMENYETFCIMAKEIGKKINSFNSETRKIIFNYYTDNNLTIEIRLYENELSRDIAKKIIDEDLNLNPHHPQIGKVLEALNNFKNFYEKKVSEETFEKLAERYPDIDIDINNLDFWEEIFEIDLQ